MEQMGFLEIVGIYNLSLLISHVSIYLFHSLWCSPIFSLSISLYFSLFYTLTHNLISSLMFPSDFFKFSIAFHFASNSGITYNTYTNLYLSWLYHCYLSLSFPPFLTISLEAYKFRAVCWLNPAGSNSHAIPFFLSLSLPFPSVRVSLSLSLFLSLQCISFFLSLYFSIFLSLSCGKIV